MISNVNSLAIVTSSICKPRAIVTSHRSIVLTLYLWTLSSSQWRCQPGRFSMVAHHHDRRRIYRCVLLSCCGRIEIDHSYRLRWSGLCCHCRHSTRGAGRPGHATAGPTRAVPAVAAGLEIRDRPVANAMRNGEGLQLIPNTVARLAIIFFTTWYVKIACFHNIKRCWKWPASHRLHASWFSLCVAWMNGFRAQGTGLRYYGMCKYRACDWPAWDARLLSVFFGYQAWSDN